MSSASGNSTASATGASPDSRGPAVLAVTLWMIAWSTAFVILRCISRLGIVRRWALDDTFIIVAWFLAFGFTFSICWGVHNGLGLHETDVTAADQLPLRKSEYAFSVLYNPVLMATKTSILCFYLTLARNQNLFRWATWATLIVVNVAGLGLTLLNIFQCRPMSTLFYPQIPESTVCTDLVVIYLSSAPVNIVTDLAILVLPFPVLTNMRLPRKQKIILIITFSFGAFVAVVDVVRIAYLQMAFDARLKEVGQKNTATSKVLQQDDFSWYASFSFLWSAIEVHVGIICACVPSLKPLVARVLPGLLRDMGNPNDKSQIKEESQMPALGGFMSSDGASPPASPAEAHFRDAGRLHDMVTEDTPRLSPPASLHLKEMSNGKKNSSLEGLGAGEISNANGNASKSEEDDGGPPEDNMDFMEFLTTPDATSPRRLHRPDTLSSTMSGSTSGDTKQGNVPFFDFYQMERKKPMTRLSNRQAFAPLAAVTTLFFLWGFAYGLLGVLNSKFAEVNNLTTRQQLGLHASYFGAYAVGPLTAGQAALTKLGFRATFITGLAIYSVGTLIFWPAAVLSSYPAYVVCNFVNGFGVSILEVAANPFVALCGPPRNAEIRLNVSQGVQAIGTIVAPLLATKVLFASVNDGGGLIDVQWAYLGIAFFDVALAVIFYYLPLPEASDDDFERVAEKRESINNAKVFGLRVVYLTLAFGIFSQFCYVGAQEAAAALYEGYVGVVAPNSALSVFDWRTVGYTVFAAGRFVTAALSYFFKPRAVLLGLYIGMIVTAAVAMKATGAAGIAMVTLYETFQAGVFSLIFAITLRGLGSFTKRGAVFITMATSGGAIFPVVVYPVTNAYGYPYSMCVVVACSVFGMLYPIYMTVTPQARAQVDPQRKSRSLPISEDGRRPPRAGLGWMQEKLHRRPNARPTTEHVEDRAEIEVVQQEKER